MLSLSSFYRAMSLVEKTDCTFSYDFKDEEYTFFINLVQILCYPMDKGWYRHNKQPLLIYIDPDKLRIVKA